MSLPEESQHEVQKLSDTVWLVPCIISPDNKEYVPLATPLTYDKKPRVRHTWSRDEDKELQRLTCILGVKAWTQIARELNATIYGSRPVRQGKQCRERWFNHVHPGLKTDTWTNEEDCLLIEKQKEMGNHWSEIAKLMPGRTENGVKNRWKSLEKKARKRYTRCANAIDRLYKLKKQKPEDASTTTSLTDSNPSELANLEVPQSVPRLSIAAVKRESDVDPKFECPKELQTQFGFMPNQFAASPLGLTGLNGSPMGMMAALAGHSPMKQSASPMGIGTPMGMMEIGPNGLTFNQMIEFTRQMYDPNMMQYYDPEAFSPSLFLSRHGQ